MPWYLCRGIRGPQAIAFAYVRVDAGLITGWTLDGPDNASPFATEESVLQFASEHQIGRQMAKPVYFGANPPPAGKTNP